MYAKKVETRPEITAPGDRINLGVSSLDIINDYLSPKAEPYIDHTIMPPPALQLTQWATKTLNPSDDQG